MALYKSALDAILDDIRDKDGVDLRTEDYTFGPPTPMDEDANGNNTTFTITANGVSSPYQGITTLKYRRLPLSDLLVLIPGVIRESKITDTLVFAQKLNKRYGLNFTADDVETTGVSLSNGAGTITLVAKDTSRYWLGSAAFTVEPGNFSLAEYIKVTNLPGLNYPSQDTSKVYGQMYSYWRDFSSQATALQALQLEGNTDVVALKDILVAVTTHGWVSEGSSRYATTGAIVEFNGLTSEHPEQFNAADYTHAAVVVLSPSCLSLSGKLTLHYNLPSTQ